MYLVLRPLLCAMAGNAELQNQYDECLTDFRQVKDVKQRALFARRRRIREMLE